MLEEPYVVQGGERVDVGRGRRTSGTMALVAVHGEAVALFCPFKEAPYWPFIEREPIVEGYCRLYCIQPAFRVSASKRHLEGAIEMLNFKPSYPKAGMRIGRGNKSRALYGCESCFDGPRRLLLCIDGHSPSISAKETPFEYDVLAYEIELDPTSLFAAL